ncbi:MAG: Veg family protein [Actinomycetota bacterium]|nr:Veg family protein [Actinomycetota bacterium]
MAVSQLPQVEVVDRIRKQLDEFIGERMRLKANMGRCKIIERDGILEETHPNLFVVKVEEKRNRCRRVSYSYADVLTKTVELSNPDSGENLLPWLL